MPSGRAPLISAIWPGFHAEVREEWRLLNVGALAVPLVDLAALDEGISFHFGILRGEIGVELADKLPA